MPMPQGKDDAAQIDTTEINAAEINTGEIKTMQVDTVEPETVKAGDEPRRCEACTVELVTIRMNVDGNDLVMESCQRCDVRRWQLAGEKIDLEQALAEVGEHVGRHR